MKHAKWMAGGTGAVLVVLLWPGPAASADTTLGGYDATAYAAVVHAEMYEPVIPLPTEPQGDFSLGYTKSTVESGPTSRATSSYLWPGDVLGDSFDLLTKQPGTSYPFQVNSRFPATKSAPAKNTIQLTNGNGMTTSSDGNATKADVTGLGIAGPDTAGGVGTGAGALAGHPSPAPPAPAVPVPQPVSSGLAALLTAKNLTSTSNVIAAGKTITSTAHAAVSNISLLKGVIVLKNVDVITKIVSDAKSATVTGGVRIGAISVAGVNLAVGPKGLVAGKSGIALPKIPAASSTVLRTLGISLTSTPIVQKIAGASGAYRARGLVVTIDTARVKAYLQSPLNTAVNLLGSGAKTQLAPLLLLKPKIVLSIGEVQASADASPAYVGGTFGGTGTGTGTGGSGGSPVGGTTGGGGSVGGTTAGTVGGVAATGGGPTGVETTAPIAMQQSALHLPPLASVPRLLILGALLFAAVLGWLLRTAGGALLGTGRNCDFGLATGVPDLRKG